MPDDRTARRSPVIGHAEMSAVLSVSLAAMLSLSASALSADIVPFGVCAHLHRGDEFRDHERELRTMEEAGIRWARTDFSWGYFEPQNDKWRFENYDAIIAAAKKHNVHLLPILCYNVDWAFPAHDHLDDWCDYVRTVVGRYKDVLKHWEVWNEPNIGFWKPEPDPEQYARLLAATHKTIKQTDPEAQVGKHAARIAPAPRSDAALAAYEGLSTQMGLDQAN